MHGEQGKREPDRESRWIVELHGEEFHVTHEHDGEAVSARPITEDGFRYAKCSRCGAIRAVTPGDERGARARAAEADDAGEQT